MPVAIWSDRFETGIKVIDAQHKSLFTAINRLEESFQVGPVEAKNSLALLSQCAREHFDTEEEFMQVLGYPTFEAHRRAHNELIFRIQDLQGRLDLGALVPDDLTAFAADWLAHHINEADMGYVRLAREKKLIP